MPTDRELDQLRQGNLRDLGGLPALAGQLLAYRRFLRSGDVSRFQSLDAPVLASLHLRTVIDLRSAAESAQSASMSARVVCSCRVPSADGARTRIPLWRVSAGWLVGIWVTVGCSRPNTPSASLVPTSKATEVVTAVDPVTQSAAAEDQQPIGERSTAVSPVEALAANCEIFDAEAHQPWFYEDPRGAEHPAVALPLHELQGAQHAERRANCERIRSKAKDPTGQIEVQCYAAAGSSDVWALVVRHDSQADSMGGWSLAFSGGGKTARQWGGMAFSYDGAAYPGGGAPALPNLEVIIDYDGDGVSECITLVAHDTDASANTRLEAQVWTFKDDTIAAYAPAARLRATGIVDQDQDGRPDLVLDPYGLVVGSSMGWFAGKRSWSTLAHSQTDGTFSQSGAAASAYARTICPGAPELGNLSHESAQCWTGAVHCSTLWGVPKLRVEAALRAYCADEASRLEQEGMPPGLGWCDASLSTWLGMVSVPLPVSLR